MQHFLLNRRRFPRAWNTAAAWKKLLRLACRGHRTLLRDCGAPFFFFLFVFVTSLTTTFFWCTLHLLCRGKHVDSVESRSYGTSDGPLVCGPPRQLQRRGSDKVCVMRGYHPRTRTNPVCREIALCSCSMSFNLSVRCGLLSTEYLENQRIVPCRSLRQMRYHHVLKISSLGAFPPPFWGLCHPWHRALRARGDQARSEDTSQMYCCTLH